MHDDERMERMDDWLRTAMTAEMPKLSPGFDSKVMRRVRPRRLDRAGRVLMLLYVVASIALSAWLMRDLNPTSIIVGLVVVILVAACSGLYGRRLAVGR